MASRPSSGTDAMVGEVSVLMLEVLERGLGVLTLTEVGCWTATSLSELPHDVS